MPDPSPRFVPGPRNLQIKHWLHRVLRLTENEKLRFSRPIWLRTILSLCNNQGILLPYHAGAIFMHFYAFIRCVYPKRLTVHSGYTYFVSMRVPWESNPQALRC